MTRVCLIPGTHSWNGSTDPESARGEWWWPGSPFAEFLSAHGVELVGRVRPFVWSTDLDGIGGPDRDWRAGGENLFAYLVPPLCPEKRVPPAETNLIAHSHGLQVALYACAAGLQVHTLISVGSPVRKDMTAVAERARPQIARWLHLHSNHSDRWQWFGELFDGRLGIVRRHPLADRNVPVPDVGHSRLLTDAGLFPRWVDDGWLSWLGGA